MRNPVRIRDKRVVQYEQAPWRNVRRVARNVLCKDDSRRQRPRVVARLVKRSDLLENGP